MVDLLCGKEDQDGYQSAFRKSLGEDWRAQIGEWRKQSWSIIDLIEQNLSLHIATLGDQLAALPVVGSDELVDSFREACLPIRGYLGQQPSGVYWRVEGALRKRNFGSSIAWRELDSYRTYRLLPEDGARISLQ